MVCDGGGLRVKPRGSTWVKPGAAGREGALSMGLWKGDPHRAAAFPWGVALGSVLLSMAVSLLGMLIKLPGDLKCGNDIKGQNNWPKNQRRRRVESRRSAQSLKYFPYEVKASEIERRTRSMTPVGALRLSLACLLLCTAAPKPTCDPSACTPCPERDTEGLATAGGCCPPCPSPCVCPPYLESDCEMQGFASGLIPIGHSFYIDFARKLCTCHSSGDITCVPLCAPLPPTCLAVGSPVADGCPRCVCYDEEEMAVPAGTVTARGTQICTCPPQGGQLQCSSGESKE
ncbi:fibulin-2-like [Chlamydotis macqueenii]